MSVSRTGRITVRERSEKSNNSVREQVDVIYVFFTFYITVIYVFFTPLSLVSSSLSLTTQDESTASDHTATQR